MSHISPGFTEQGNAFFSAVQEIANNDLKYGYGMSEWRLSLSSTREKNLRVTICSPTHFPKQTEGFDYGHGTGNIHQRISELGGCLQTEWETSRYRIQVEVPWYR